MLIQELQTEVTFRRTLKLLIWLPLFPGSSAVEQATVNRLAGGSNPSRGAILLQLKGACFSVTR